MKPNPESFSMHPCFDPQARHLYGRIHLPVAPKCNVQCNFCNRKFDCANETRPGVTSAVLKPHQALNYLDAALKINPNIAVVGIAGPGDPFANAEETMETFRLVRRKYKDMLLCVSTNGLGIYPHIEELDSIGVSHVTITINAVDPEVGANIYSWVRGIKTNRTFTGLAAAKSLLEHQLEALEELKRRGIVVKINTLVLPGVNDEHIPAVAEKVGSMGADIMNCISFIPVEGTVFEDLPAPTGAMVARTRLQSRQHVSQMAHCARCRADAVGLLGQKCSPEFDGMLERFSTSYSPLDERPYVAVATKDGLLVNVHLGIAKQFQIYAKRDDGYECITTRTATSVCCGGDRWAELEKLLHDCRAVLVSAVGPPPKAKLQELGLLVLDKPCMIQDGLDEVYEDLDLSRLRERIGAGCPGPEDGVPGC